MTMYSVLAPTISEADTLVYYNGPLLVLASLGDHGNRVMAAALKPLQSQDSFLVVEITSEQERRLLANEVTLRALCLECLPPQGLGVYHLREFYSAVWELTPMASIAEEDLPGDTPLRRMP